jgi:hypothetical protein
VTLNVANPAWERGPIIKTLSENTTTQVQGSVKLNNEQQTQLIVGMMYINIPTELYPYGEIRGQIMADKFEE